MSEQRVSDHDLMMLRKLANGEEPYGDGPFDSHHIEVDQRLARQLVDELDAGRSNPFRP